MPRPARPLSIVPHAFPPRGRRALSSGAARALLLVLGATMAASGADDTRQAATLRFREAVEPVLFERCFECHDSANQKGRIDLERAAADPSLSDNRELWINVLRNIRSGLMPPASKPRLGGGESRAVADWVKQGVLGIDPADVDPGRSTLRRLNRVEYRNTVSDLMGVDYNTLEEFPPDDSGYGFDNIGDVLSVSPLLLEKYLQAAESIVTQAVPTVSRVVRRVNYSGFEFRADPGAQGQGPRSATRVSFYEPAKLTRTVQVDTAGARRIVVDFTIDGSFDFDPGKCRLVFRADDRELLSEEFGWHDNLPVHKEYELDWDKGEHKLVLELTPLTPVEKKKTNLDVRVTSVAVEGPLAREHWVRPRDFDRFFHADDPGTREGRRDYAREVLRRFTTRAYRRPADARTLDRLVGLAETTFSQPGKSVEEGLARAFVAVLASPRFLFRVEEPDPADDGKRFPRVDEYALASRLSYLFWSTMPDEELFRLAEKHELRAKLPQQVKRLLADTRSERMARNFTGQWLQARDIESIPVDARTILARDDGEEKELARERDEFRALLAEREAESKKAAQNKQAPDAAKAQNNAGSIRRSGRFRRLFATPRVDLDDPLRQAMRRETEMFFTGIVRENRSVLELLDSNYTYLNERLAKHYGIPGVKGEEMRKVELPKDSPRGGVLTQGTVLVVTSNPTRTSPVKRGLFVLDNILGTPAPPAPPSVPQLEESEKGFKDREPTLREVLELHRRQPLCNACHSRMDPLGLGLENFNALGLYREKERGQPLDTGGKLLTGETFSDVRTLKTVLREKHRFDFYRCLTEKFLTYAIGRGVESSDVESVDRIVDRLEKEGGAFSALLAGVVDSAPFQKRRARAASGETSEPVKKSGDGIRKSRTGAER